MYISLKPPYICAQWRKSNGKTNTASKNVMMLHGFSGHPKVANCSLRHWSFSRQPSRSNIDIFRNVLKKWPKPPISGPIFSKKWGFLQNCKPLDCQGQVPILDASIPLVFNGSTAQVDLPWAGPIESSRWRAQAELPIPRLKRTAKAE